MRCIDLLGLYVSFYLFRPRDATRGNSFFARANVLITNEKNGITWSEMGKQNIQAKRVYCYAFFLWYDGIETSGIY